MTSGCRPTPDHIAVGSDRRAIGEGDCRLRPSHLPPLGATPHRRTSLAAGSKRKPSDREPHRRLRRSERPRQDRHHERAWAEGRPRSDRMLHACSPRRRSLAALATPSGWREPRLMPMNLEDARGGVKPRPDTNFPCAATRRIPRGTNSRPGPGSSTGVPAPPFGRGSPAAAGPPVGSASTGAPAPGTTSQRRRTTSWLPHLDT